MGVTIVKMNYIIPKDNIMQFKLSKKQINKFQILFLKKNSNKNILSSLIIIA